MDVLLVSQDADTRQQMALVVRSIERRVGEELRFRAARDGELGAKAAFRDRPDVIVADEIATRAGAFGARTLRDALDPYTGVIVAPGAQARRLARQVVGGGRMVREARGSVRAGGSSARARDRAEGAEEREGARVKIKGTCKRDDREFLAEQVVELGG